MKKLQLALAALAAAGTLSLATPAPAFADSAASTRNIILGVAAITGLAIESNVAHKHAQANTIKGYLQDGSPVYGDGHVVTGNGYSYYPGNQGQSVSCSNGRCSITYNNGNYTNGNYQTGNYGNPAYGNANYADPNHRNFDEERDHQPDRNRGNQ